MRVKIFLMRHSKSCSNHMRSLDENDTIGQQIRDPGLTAIGHKMAAAYQPLLQKRLAEAGFDLDTAVIGSSALRRAKETATTLFPGRPVVTVPHFIEHGVIPENTPRQSLHRSKKPSWPGVVDWIRRTLPSDGSQQLIAVGHGSYLRAEIGPPGGSRISNMDGFILDLDITPSGYTIRNRTRIDYNAPVSPDTPGDQCVRDADRIKIVTMRRMARPRTRSRKTQKKQQQKNHQRGAGYTMPAAYFQPGAQMYNTSATETGKGIAAWNPDNGWARTALPASGQRGGFVPSVMGSFVNNGMRLVPLAGYLGYKGFSRQTKSKAKSKSKRTRRSKRQTSRHA